MASRNISSFTFILIHFNLRMYAFALKIKQSRTPVTFPKITVFWGKRWNYLGDNRYVFSRCPGPYRSLFCSRTNFMSLRPSLNFFSVADFSWIVRRATLGHCPTIVGQCLVSVLRRSTLRRFEFCWILAARHQLTTENWPTVDWSFRVILTNRLLDDRCKEELWHP